MRMALVAVHKIRENVYYDDRTGNIYYEATENITDVLRENEMFQKDERNGFTEDRTMRQMCNVPNAVFHQFARRTGYYGMDGADKKKELEKFLKEYRQYCTGKDGLMKHDTAHQGNIIIK
jgi:hypothetical protein